MSESPALKQPDSVPGIDSPWLAAWCRFKSEPLAVCGLCGILFMLALAVFAPLLANARPFIIFREGNLAFPFFYYIFAPDTLESIVERFFNYLMLYIPVFIILKFLLRAFRPNVRISILLLAAILLAVPFFTTPKKLERTDWRAMASTLKSGEFAVFAPIPYGPFENIGTPYEKSSSKHLLGTDQIGRDLLCRMLYGARVSLAVGFAATAIAMFIGISVGLFSGYSGGRTDLVIMRIVEIIICFPTFLLLLILMALMMDRKFEQSIILVILVIGFTDWTGLSRLVRGETLKQRVMPYILSCESLGIPSWRIMTFHLLPNIMAPVLVTFTFSVAGAVLVESGLSFLGFGVQEPMASWGELLREAFADPFNYWHLTLWPGLALFLTVCAFNFTGEGLRKVFDPKA